MSEEIRKDQQERAEMHRIDSERNTEIQLARRDSELYFALGIFIVALGLPVVFGTYYAYQWGDFRPAIVNLISGLVMVGIGAASIFYGWFIRRRIRGEQ